MVRVSWLICASLLDPLALCERTSDVSFHVSLSDKTPFTEAARVYRLTRQGDDWYDAACNVVVRSKVKSEHFRMFHMVETVDSNETESIARLVGTKLAGDWNWRLEREDGNGARTLLGRFISEKNTHTWRFTFTAVSMERRFMSAGLGFEDVVSRDAEWNRYQGNLDLDGELGHDGYTELLMQRRVAWEESENISAQYHDDLETEWEYTRPQWTANKIRITQSLADRVDVQIAETEDNHYRVIWAAIAVAESSTFDV